MDEREVSLTIPLQITLRIGSAAIEAATSSGRSGTVAVAAEAAGIEAARPLSYYQGYTGYDSAFLGTAVALPQLTDAQRQNAATNIAAGTGQDPTVLPYTHFSIVVNRARQLAYYTAVNIDGAQSTDVNRGRDRWYFDPRIAESEQIGEALYSRNALDRGHLVRRLDPVWGSPARRANDDTFHFTNCSPQHERFNQGQDLWQGLENFILDNADAQDRKVTVFTGPVMNDADPIYKGVRLPLAFWKILVYTKSDGSLVSAAYVLEQGQLIHNIPGLEAAFSPGTFRVTLSHLIERTGLDFNDLTANELPLSSGALEAGVQRVAILPSYSNVVL